jgi:endogenous inhibitor of DNA gyrase (YacG/DUF329 family)
MPIRRTFACPDCGHFLEVELSLEEYDALPPECPNCQADDMQQEFKPFAIGGSARAKAVKLAEDIMEKDYGVADAKVEGKEGGTPTVRYKDVTIDQARQAMATAAPSTWTAGNETLQTAMAYGRQTRLKHGSGLDVLQHNLKNGSEPDLIEISKRRAIRVN